MKKLRFLFELQSKELLKALSNEEVDDSKQFMLSICLSISSCNKAQYYFGNGFFHKIERIFPLIPTDEKMKYVELTSATKSEFLDATKEKVSIDLLKHYFYDDKETVYVLPHNPMKHLMEKKRLYGISENFLLNYEDHIEAFMDAILPSYKPKVENQENQENHQENHQENPNEENQELPAPKKIIEDDICFES